MKIINFKLIVIVFLVTGIYITSAISQNTIDFTAEGVATVFSGDKGLARDQAIDDALRKAVEQGLGTFVQSSTLVENYQVVSDNILSWSEGYVKNYNVLSEGLIDETTYQVKIQAQLQMSDMQSDWESVQSILDQMQNPRVLIIMDEKNIGQSYDQYHFLSVDMTSAEAALINKFLEKGFDVIDAATMRANVKRDQAAAAASGNSTVAASIARSLGAEVVITGKAIAKVATGINLGGMKSCQANLTARVIKADIASIIATSSEHAAYPHIDEVTGGTKAIEKAANKMGDELISKITKKWKDEFYKSTTIKLVVDGIQSFTQVNDFKTTLKYHVRGIKNIYQRNYSDGRVELDIKITGNANQLARELEAKNFEKFAVQVNGMTMNKITAKLLEK